MNPDPVTVAPRYFAGPKHIVGLDDEPKFIRNCAGMFNLQARARFRRIANETIKTARQSGGNTAGFQSTCTLVAPIIVIHNRTEKRKPDYLSDRHLKASVACEEASAS
jgi:hypothetical protein